MKIIEIVGIFSCVTTFCEKRKEKLGFCIDKCDSCRNMRTLEIRDYTELSKSILDVIMTKQDVNKTKVKKFYLVLRLKKILKV